MFEQYELPYDYTALEPYIDGETVETHYTKHHAAYTKNFNDLIAQIPSLQGKTAEEILSDLKKVPEEFRQAVKNNGGGYYNHNLYFQSLSPNGGGQPKGALLKRVLEDYESFDNFKAQLVKAAVGQFGSGYAWLMADKKGRLYITQTSNQDSPLMDKDPNMLLLIDVWEHAYYLQYKNLRAKHVEELFNIIDWDIVEMRYENILSVR